MNYQMTEQDSLRIISRAGKATGSNKYFMNVVQEGNRPFCPDFENAVTSWIPVSEMDSIDPAETLILSTSDPFSCVQTSELWLA